MNYDSLVKTKEDKEKDKFEYFYMKNKEAKEVTE